MGNAVYPKLKGIGFPVNRKYEWKTLRTYEHPTGVDKSFISQIYPSSITFALKYTILRDWGFGQNELTTLVGFFNAMKSGFEDFLYEDDSFNYIENQPLKLADGITKKFQLVANYGEALIPIYGKIKDSTTPNVYINGTQVYNFTISDYGVLEFEEAPSEGSIITITAYFYHRVKFYTNVLDVQQMAFNASSLEIELKTFKPSRTTV